MFVPIESHNDNNVETVGTLKAWNIIYAAAVLALSIIAVSRFYEYFPEVTVGCIAVLALVYPFVAMSAHRCIRRIGALDAMDRDMLQDPRKMALEGRRMMYLFLGVVAFLIALMFFGIMFFVPRMRELEALYQACLKNGGH